MRLSLAGSFRARWSAKIHEEWIESLLANRTDLTRQQLHRTRDFMNGAAPNATVSGYEPLISSLALPDLDDRHVLAAAIHCRADIILTNNLRDFPETILQSYGLKAQSPDEFLLKLLRDTPDEVMTVMENHRGSLKNPPMTIAGYLDSLELQGLPRTVAAVRSLRQLGFEK